MRTKQTTFLLGLAVLTLVFGGMSCNVFRSEQSLVNAENEEKRRTEEAIANDPRLQDLDRLCMSIPTLENSSLETKRKSFNKQTYLIYGYKSSVSYSQAKQIYTDFFLKDGWNQIEDGSGFKTAYITFRKDGYRVSINYGGMGERENYAILCEKLH